MKKVITLFFLALTSSSLQYAMEIENKHLKDTVIPISNHGIFDQYEATRNYSECPSFGIPKCYTIYQPKIITWGICRGLLSFGGVEALAAGVGALKGTPEFALDPIFLTINGIMSLGICLIYFAAYEDAMNNGL